MKFALNPGVTISSIYENFCKGNPLSDDEIRVAIPYFKDIADKLVRCGPVFRLAFEEANRVYMTMDDFRRNRRMKD